MEKKWMKRAAITAMVIAAAGAFAGCGGSGEKKEAKAADGSSAKVGFITAYTGPGAAYGISQKEAMDMAVEEINSAKDTKVKIDLITYDTALKKTEAINAVKRAVEQDKVLAIIGPMTTGEFFASGPIAQQAGCVTFGISLTANGVTEVGDYVFRNSVPGKLAIPATVKKAHEKLGFKKVAVMYSNNNDMLVAENEIYQKLFPEMGVEIVATETFADKDTDFSAQLTNIQAANPEVIAIAGFYQEGSLIVKKAREMGMNQPIIGNNGFNSPEYIKQGGAAADGTLVATPWNPDRKSDKAQEFRKKFKEKYGHEPDQFAAQAYDGIYMVHYAIEQSGTTTDRKQFRDTLATIKGFEGVTGKFEFDQDRNPKMDMDVLEVKDGKWVPFA